MANKLTKLASTWIIVRYSVILIEIFLMKRQQQVLTNKNRTERWKSDWYYKKKFDQSEKCRRVHENIIKC